MGGDDVEPHLLVLDGLTELRLENTFSYMAVWLEVDVWRLDEREFSLEDALPREILHRILDKNLFSLLTQRNSL